MPSGFICAFSDQLYEQILSEIAKNLCGIMSANILVTIIGLAFVSCSMRAFSRLAL